MKKIIVPLVFCLLAITATAAKLDISHIDDVDVEAYNPPTKSKYISETDDNYKGRNKGVTALKTAESLNAGTGLSKVVTKKTSKQSTQLDNLETNAGEMVQKIEDDKNRVKNNQEEIYSYSRKELSLAQEYASQIELEHLGQELDPTVTNAFKCKDIENCNHETDTRVIANCESGDMLHWDGDAWQCIGIFESPDGPNCNQDQWITTLPTGDKACVDYIYQWGYKIGTCTSGYKTDVAVCYRKQKQSDAGVIIGDDKCYGPKPKNIVIECNANWQVSGWGGCSKSCNGGVQYRTVSCPTGYKCKAAKPITSQACNTHICTTNWRVTSWYGLIREEPNERGPATRIYGYISGCNDPRLKKYIKCDTETITRNVYCPSGYRCVGAKPPHQTQCSGPNDKYSCGGGW